jgi:glycosyltransferase 2 family protein
VAVARRDLGAAAIAGVVLLLTAALAARHRAAPGEASIVRLVNHLPGGAVDPVEVFMTLGTITGVVLVAVVVGAVTRRIGPPLAVLGAGLLARLITPLVKDLVERGRPAVLLDDVRVREHPGGFGFPSSHTSIAVAVAVVVACCIPKARWPVLVIAALVAVGRMYVGVHLPLDLLGGAALGVLAATPFVLLLRR